MMGFRLLRSRKRRKKREPLKKRKHIILPWIGNPTKGARADSLVFGQRHEANTIELFFDLFFVANLATFTAYHAVTDRSELLAYIGFFGIIWGSWFAITLFDVRFAIDSVYERACKVIQFAVFVGFALVGSQFQPGVLQDEDNNANFRMLSVLLAVSRVLLAIQYLVVLLFCAKAKFNKLILPLGLCSFFYLLTAACFGLMTLAFLDDTSHHVGVYSLWYVAVFCETALVLGISSIWRMLSFTKTHLVERMGLLTLIVIGEGAIGITKTISAMMAKRAPNREGSMLIFSIIMVLIFLWMMYFDNHPHGQHGTIRQQIWALLHFPLHLSIVGLVEGSQQLTRARYVLKSVIDAGAEMIKYCSNLNYDGRELGKAINKTLDYYQLDRKAESTLLLPQLYADVARLVKSKGVCSANNTARGEFPDSFDTLMEDLAGVMYATLGTKIPKGENAADVAGDAWHITFNYYWAALLLFLFTNIIMLYLVRKAKADIFDLLSMLVRFVCLGVSAILLFLGVKDENFYGDYIISPAMVPTAAMFLFVIVSMDALGRVLSNWRLRRSGAAYIDLAALIAHEHGHAKHSDDRLEEKEDFGMHTVSYDTLSGHTFVTPLAAPEYVPLMSQSSGHLRHPSVEYILDR